MLADSNPEAFVRSVEDLLEERQSLMQKERSLIQSLNRVLARMGYEVMSLQNSEPAGRRRGRKPGRPKGSGRNQGMTKGLKRRGRPPKISRTE